MISSILAFLALEDFCYRGLKFPCVTVIKYLSVFKKNINSCWRVSIRMIILRLRRTIKKTHITYSNELELEFGVIAKSLTPLLLPPVWTCSLIETNDTKLPGHSFGAWNSAAPLCNDVVKVLWFLNTSTLQSHQNFASWAGEMGASC